MKEQLREENWQLKEQIGKLSEYPLKKSDWERFKTIEIILPEIESFF
jgi:hypothetical protein